MSFFAGLTLEKHCVLLSDRRRLILEDKPTHDDSDPKIWKIREDLYVTGAGLLHFIDGYLKLVLPKVVKDSPLEMALLRAKLPEWQVEFSRIYKEMNQSVLSQMESEGLDVNEQKFQITSAMLGGH